MTTRVAIVTGGASGIGLAIAERLTADGYPVAIFDRNGDAALEMAEKIGGAPEHARVETGDLHGADAFPVRGVGDVEARCQVEGVDREPLVAQSRHERCADARRAAGDDRAPHVRPGSDPAGV